MAPQQPQPAAKNELVILDAIWRGLACDEERPSRFVRSSEKFDETRWRQVAEGVFPHPLTALLNGIGGWDFNYCLLVGNGGMDLVGKRAS